MCWQQQQKNCVEKERVETKTKQKNVIRKKKFNSSLNFIVWASLVFNSGSAAFPPDF